MKCRRCGKKAVASFRGQAFCGDCFVHIFENSIRKFSRRYGIVEEGDRILAAVSGGKDSAAMLSVLKLLSEEVSAEVRALFIDLSIHGYTTPQKKAAIQLSRELEVPLDVVSITSLFPGSDLAGISEMTGRPVCSVCGTLKRYIINRHAFEGRFTKVATGHNMDDFAEFFIRSLPEAPKAHPHIAWNGTAVARIRPLMEMSEKEVMQYVLLKGLPFSGLECPLAQEARIKRALLLVEKASPGFRLRLMRFLMSLPSSETPVRLCEKCNMPSSGRLCTVCRWRELSEKT